MESKYPNLDVLSEVRRPSQTIREFLEWLGEQDIDLCTLISGPGFDRWAPITEGQESLIARYFGIDMNAVEHERRAMLDEIRAANERKS